MHEDTQEQINKCLNCTKEECDNCTPKKKPTRSSARRIDLTGQRFGSWTVIKPATRECGTATNAHWLCRCDCGTESVVSGKSLRIGGSTGCFYCRFSRRKKNNGNK